jgi:Ca2+-binding EF-hand superfamily protein
LALPGLIGERLFNLFDLDKDGYLEKQEFKKGLGRMFSQSFKENVRLIYDLFDFDSDGKVSKEDIRTLLSHVPLAQAFDIKKVKTEISSNAK